MTKKTILKSVLPFIVLIIIIFVINNVLDNNGKQQSPQIVEKSWTVQSIKVKKMEASPEIILYGQVESPKQATLASTIETDVTDVLIKEGDVVKKGDLLIVLNAEEFDIIASQKKAAIEEIKAQIETEMTEYANDLKSQEYLEKLVNTNQLMMQRLEKLQAKKLEAQSNVDEALNKLLLQRINLVQKQLEVANHKNILAQLIAKKKQLEAAYRQSLLDVEDSKVIAPFDGRITKVLVAPGDVIIPSSKLVSLYNVNDVEIRAQLPQKYLSITSKALLDKKPLIANIDAPITIELPAVRTGASLKTGSSTIDLFFKIPNDKTYEFPLNQTVKLNLELPTINNIYLIPATSVYGESRIYRIENSRLNSVNVNIVGEKYIKGQLYYLVKQKDLPSELNVLVSKLPNARDGLKVTTK